MKEEILAEDFSDGSWTAEQLTDTLFEDCSFHHCSFQDIKLENTIFRNCDFKQCSWANISFMEVKFQECRFTEGTMIGLQLNHGLVPTFEIAISQSKAEFCIWEEMSLRNCSWKDSLVKDCNFYGCDLQAVSFVASDFTDTGFDRCKLQKTDFTDASNYAFDPATNPVKDATFSSPAVLALLQPLGINIR